MVSRARARKLFRELERADPSFMEKIEPFLAGLYYYYFRAEVKGWENVPDQKALYVGNHNGLVTWEVLMLFFAWWKRFGTSRRALGLAHDVAIDNPFFRWITPKIGAIPASPEIALEALERDYSLLVFPGGLKDAFRSIRDWKKIDFFQRKGFIRLAIKAKVPIVPLISCGAQESYLILDRGDELAKKLGIKDKFRIDGIPMTPQSLFFAWCMASGLFTFFPLLLAPMAFASIWVPLPAKMTFRILPAIDPMEEWNPKLSEEENYQKIYDKVTKAMQKALTEEYKKRKYPIIG